MDSGVEMCAVSRAVVRGEDEELGDAEAGWEFGKLDFGRWEGVIFDSW